MRLCNSLKQSHQEDDMELVDLYLDEDAERSYITLIPSKIAQERRKRELYRLYGIPASTSEEQNQDAAKEKAQAQKAKKAMTNAQRRQQYELAREARLELFKLATYNQWRNRILQEMEKGQTSPTVAFLEFISRKLDLKFRL
ncbi:hypothetical protein MIR68_007360 [Amoeboaphelidium protococcarum]|nr:hypothetical protein MIR68_007360 [Amoeboaphelidium protococcarum]